MRKTLAFLALLAGTGGAPAFADSVQPAQYLTYCLSGASAPLRQTIIVVDEDLIPATTANKAPDNSAWVRPIQEIAEGQLAGSQPMLPHEKLSVYIERTAGADLELAFVGCSPQPTGDEMAALQQSHSGMSGFFGGDAASTVKGRFDDFNTALVGALRGVVNTVSSDPPTSGKSSFLEGLANTQRLGDLSDGIPRVLLISDFAEVDPTTFAIPKDARIKGFADGDRLGIDLQRAEVYVSGLKPSSLSTLKPYLASMLLGSRGLLMGVTIAGGLPPLAENPVSVQVYSGTLALDSATLPVQVRIAYDKSGSLTNSWAEITTNHDVATPISGKAVCQNQSCDFVGDGQEMGQAWNPDPASGLAFSSDFGWSGLRYFDMKVSGTAGHIKIWDPSVSAIQGSSSPDFEFEVTQTPSIQF